MFGSPEDRFYTKLRAERDALRDRWLGGDNHQLDRLIAIETLIQIRALRQDNGVGISGNPSS